MFIFVHNERLIFLYILHDKLYEGKRKDLRKPNYYKNKI